MGESWQVGVRDLKNSLSAHLERVKDGQHIVVTQRGRPVAMLGPLNVDVDRMAALVAAGVVQPPRSKVRRLPAERVSLNDAVSLDDDIAAQRR